MLDCTELDSQAEQNADTKYYGKCDRRMPYQSLGMCSLMISIRCICILVFFNAKWRKNIKFWKHINMYTIRLVARTLWIDLSMYLNYGLIILMQHEKISFVMKNTSDTCPVSKYELPTPSEHEERADWNLKRFWMHFGNKYSWMAKKSKCNVEHREF